MEEMKFSDQLAKKLGDRENEIKDYGKLLDFQPILVEMMEANNCSDIVRESVLNKMEKLSTILLKIYAINKMHISNDAKKEKIEKELDGFDFSSFKNALYTEILHTDRTLKTKIKNIGKNIYETAKEKTATLKKVIEDNMKLVKEEREAAKKKESELKRKSGKNVELESDVMDVPEEDIKEVKNKKLSKEELEAKKADLLSKREEVKETKKTLEDKYEKISDDKQLVVSSYKALGFFETFNRLWEHRKDNPDKKQGFFSIVKNAYKESRSKKNEPRAIELKEQKDDLYNKQLEVAMQIKKADNDYKKLSRQLKDLERDITRSAEEALVSAREALDEVVTPPKAEEITPSKLKDVTEKVAKLDKNAERGKAWKEKIYKVIDTILDYSFGPVLEPFFEEGPDKTEELKKGVSEAKEKRDNAQTAFEAANKIKESRDKVYEFSSEKVASLTKEDYIEDRIGNRVIKGVNKAQSMMANVRYKRKKKELEKAENQVKKAEEKLEKYTTSRRGSQGMDR